MAILLNEEFASNLNSWLPANQSINADPWIWNSGEARVVYTVGNGPSEFLYQQALLYAGVTYVLDFKLNTLGSRGLHIYTGDASFSSVATLPGSSEYSDGVHSISFQLSQDFESIGFQAEFNFGQSSPGHYIEVEYFRLSVISCDLQINSVDVIHDINTQEVGSLTVNASSSFEIEYSLNGTTWQDSNIFEDLTSGSYTVYVRDSQDCTDSASATINNTPCDIQIASLIVTHETAVGANNGTVVVAASSSASSGTLDIQFSLDGAASITTVNNIATYTGLAPGVHTIFIRDDANCLVSQNFTIIAFLVIDPDCFNPIMAISELNPYKFKLLKCNPDDEIQELFNEVDICGVNKECFTQIAKCDDVLTFQIYYVDATYNTRPVLEVVDYYDETIYDTINLVSLGAGYYKLEKNIAEITDICEKTVYLLIKSQNSGNDTQYFEHARSEPILISNHHNCSLLLEYWNDNNFNTMRYEGTALGYVNKMRIFAQAWKEEFPQEKTVYVKSNGERVLLKSEVNEKRLLEVGYVPNYIHKIIALALSHQHVRIGSTEYVCEDDYSFDNLARYALSKGKAKLSTKQYLKKNQIR